MSDVSYLRDDGSYITHEDLEERAIKYIRNVKLGLMRILTLEQLENWLRLDCRLALLPPIAVLDQWLSLDTVDLAKWSYENDFPRKVTDN